MKVKVKEEVEVRRINGKVKEDVHIMVVVMFRFLSSLSNTPEEKM